MLLIWISLLGCRVSGVSPYFPMWKSCRLIGPVFVQGGGGVGGSVVVRVVIRLFVNDVLVELLICVHLGGP